MTKKEIMSAIDMFEFKSPELRTEFIKRYADNEEFISPMIRDISLSWGIEMQKIMQLQPGGMMMSMKKLADVAMMNISKDEVAAQENWYYTAGTVAYYWKYGDRLLTVMRLINLRSKFFKAIEGIFTVILAVVLFPAYMVLADNESIDIWDILLAVGVEICVIVCVAVIVYALTFVLGFGSI